MAAAAGLPIVRRCRRPRRRGLGRPRAAWHAGGPPVAGGGLGSAARAAAVEAAPLVAAHGSPGCLAGGCSGGQPGKGGKKGESRSPIIFFPPLSEHD